MRSALALTIALLIVSEASGDIYLGGAESLGIQPSARFAGLGDCTIAVADDASACSWNPGGLAFIDGEISVTAAYSKPIREWEDTRFIYGAYGARVGETSVFAASVTFLSYDEQEAATPGAPNPLVNASAHEIVPSVAFGTAIGEHFGVGLNAKYIRVDIVPAYAAPDGDDLEGFAFAADLGVELRTRHTSGDLDLLVRAGGAVLNHGIDIAYFDAPTTSPLPRNYKLGGSCEFTYAGVASALICVQHTTPMVKAQKDHAGGVWGFGLEVQASAIGLFSRLAPSESPVIRDLLSLRLGHQRGDEGAADGHSFGFGVGVEVNDEIALTLDFAKVPQSGGFERPFERPWRMGVSGWVSF